MEPVIRTLCDVTKWLWTGSFGKRMNVK